MSGRQAQGRGQRSGWAVRRVLLAMLLGGLPATAEAQAQARLLAPVARAGVPVVSVSLLGAMPPVSDI